MKKKILVLALIFGFLYSANELYVPKIEEEIEVPVVEYSFKELPTTPENNWKNYKEEKVIKEKEDLDLYWDVYSVAEKLLGHKGSCYAVMKEFVLEYYGKDFELLTLEKIPYEEARPGDIIYYKNGSLGLQHWAVYIGNDIALHGNFNKTTIFYSIYLKGGTSPIFYRVI